MKPKRIRICGVCGQPFTEKDASFVAGIPFHLHATANPPPQAAMTGIPARLQLDPLVTTAEHQRRTALTRDAREGQTTPMTRKAPQTPGPLDVDGTEAFRRTEGDETQISICIRCGSWDRFDDGIDRYGKCFDGDDHTVGRVRLLLAPLTR